MPTSSVCASNIIAADRTVLSMLRQQLALRWFSDVFIALRYRHNEHPYGIAAAADTARTAFRASRQHLFRSRRSVDALLPDDGILKSRPLVHREGMRTRLWSSRSSIRCVGAPAGPGLRMACHDGILRTREPMTADNLAPVTYGECVPRAW